MALDTTLKVMYCNLQPAHTATCTVVYCIGQMAPYFIMAILILYLIDGPLFNIYRCLRYRTHGPVLQQGDIFTGLNTCPHTAKWTNSYSSLQLALTATCTIMYCIEQLAPCCKSYKF